MDDFDTSGMALGCCLGALALVLGSFLATVFVLFVLLGAAGMTMEQFLK